MLYQGAVSSATTLFFGRNFGNVVRSAENYFIEWEMNYMVKTLVLE